MKLRLAKAVLYSGVVLFSSGLNNKFCCIELSKVNAFCIIVLILKVRIVSPYVLVLKIWATSWRNQQNGMCAQRRLRSAWASLLCALTGWLRTQGFFMRTANTLIRLGGCPGWFESSLGAHTILSVFAIIFFHGLLVRILFRVLNREWSGEPSNATDDTDCVNVNYGGYYEVKKCSTKQAFICQRPVGLPWQSVTGSKGTPIKLPFLSRKQA